MQELDKLDHSLLKQVADLTKERNALRAVVQSINTDSLSDDAMRVVVECGNLRQQVADLTKERDALKVEVAHYREACASVGETDGHGWAETTKELKSERDALKEIVAKIAEGQDTVKVLTEGMALVMERDKQIGDLTRQLAEAMDHAAGLSNDVTHLGEKLAEANSRIDELEGDFMLWHEKKLALEKALAASEQAVKELKSKLDAHNVSDTTIGWGC